MRQEYDKRLLPNLNKTNHTTYGFKNLFSLINQRLSHDAKIQWQGLLPIIVETSLTKKCTQNTNYLYLSVSADAVFTNMKSSPHIIANQIKKLALNITYLVCKINR